MSNAAPHTRARRRRPDDAFRDARGASSAMKNHASRVAIAGERGVGKTTLLNGLIARAVFRESDGSPVRASSALERDGHAIEVRVDALTRRVM